MALTESTMAIGVRHRGAGLCADRCGDSGKTVRRDDFRGQKALLVMFICTHCPYVKHVEKGLAALGRTIDGEPVGIVAISSNDAENYPDDRPGRAEATGANDGLPLPLPL